MYKENISFRRLKNDYVSSECPICYLPIHSTQNIVFGCLHNCCSGCLLAHLKSSLKKENVPICFLCRSPLCVFDSRNRDLKNQMYALLRKEDEVKVETEVEAEVEAEVENQPVPTMNYEYWWYQDDAFDDAFDDAPGVMERDYENAGFLEDPGQMVMVHPVEPIDRVYVVHAIGLVRGYENMKTLGRGIFYGILIWGLTKLFFEFIFYNASY